MLDSKQRLFFFFLCHKCNYTLFIGAKNALDSMGTIGLTNGDDNYLVIDGFCTQPIIPNCSNAPLFTNKNEV